MSATSKGKEPARPDGFQVFSSPMLIRQSTEPVARVQPPHNVSPFLTPPAILQEPEAPPFKPQPGDTVSLDQFSPKKKNASQFHEHFVESGPSTVAEPFGPTGKAKQIENTMPAASMDQVTHHLL